MRQWLEPIWLTASPLASDWLVTHVSWYISELACLSMLPNMPSRIEKRFANRLRRPAGRVNNVIAGSPNFYSTKRVLCFDA